MNPVERAAFLVESCLGFHFVAIHIADEYLGEAMEKGDTDSEFYWAEVIRHMTLKPARYDA